MLMLLCGFDYFVDENVGFHFTYMPKIGCFSIFEIFLLLYAKIDFSLKSC